MVNKIRIDDKKYDVEKNSMTGRELRQLADIPLDKRLVLNINNEPDIEIENEISYDLKNNMQFYSELFKSSISIIIDGKSFIIEKQYLTGEELMDLAKLSFAEYKLIKEVKNGMDIPIEKDIVYQIGEKDIFFAVPTGINNGALQESLILKDKKYLEDNGYNYKIYNDGSYTLLIIKDFPLSDDFDLEKTDILIKIPTGYPITPLDMFWACPHIKIKNTSSYPPQADVFESYQDKEWQRFSRHYQWKPTYSLANHIHVIKDVLVNGRG